MIAPVYSQRQVSPAVEDALRAAMAPLAAAENERLRGIMHRTPDAEVSKRCRQAALKRGDAKHQRWIRETVVRMAREGATNAAIAAAVGRHETRIINILRNERARGVDVPKPPDPRRARFEADKARVAELRAEGMKNGKIAEALNTSKARVEKMVGALRREGRL